MSHYIHPLGLCETLDIGEGSTVWAFAHVLAGATIGRDVNICDHVFVENDVIVGDRVTLKCGVQLWDGTRIGNDVFVGPNVTLTNDRFPRSKQHLSQYPELVICDGASIGGGAVLLPGIRIGRDAMVGAGAVVVADVPPHAIVVGNPARIVGHTDVDADTVASPPAASLTAPVRLATDLRGSLAALEFSDLPFVPQRFFTVYGVPSRDIRGQHAHRQCEQYLMCLAGSVTCMVDDGKRRQTVVLDRPDQGLHLPAMTWGSQYNYSHDAVLAVFASLPYDAADYIRSHDEWLRTLCVRETCR